MDLATIRPLEGPPRRCDALFWGQNGPCPNPAVWDAVSFQNEIASLCDTHIEHYRKLQRGESGADP